MTRLDAKKNPRAIACDRGTADRLRRAEPGTALKLGTPHLRGVHLLRGSLSGSGAFEGDEAYCSCRKDEHRLRNLLGRKEKDQRNACN